MYIKSVIIDGFKSYGTHTEIIGFDKEFNAITGFNGTGKSNILDSICFVLGITNLTHVRANSLQDLIYKSGQAGITKASVTIKFNNEEKSLSPINYEHYDEINVTRQIAVAGKNRYLINGSVVTNKQVNDLFNSVQLNVNNPHFLIMQGRITKVLNMKPIEILSMIEEAAGTRMYETKKMGAQKTIEKKDVKLKEMNVMVNESINPKLQRLKEERSLFNEKLRIDHELDKLNKVHNAWQFMNYEEDLEEREKILAETEQWVETSKKDVDTWQNDCKAIDARIVEMENTRDKETSGALQELEAELKNISNAEAVVSGRFKSAEDSLTREKKQLGQTEKNLKDEEAALASKKTELEKLNDLFDKLRNAEQEDLKSLNEAQEKFQAVSAGLMASDTGSNATLQDQLMEAKRQLTAAETEIKQADIELKHFKQELDRKKPMLQKTATNFNQDKKEMDAKEKELNNLQKSIERLNYEEGLIETLNEQYRVANAEKRRCLDIVKNFENRYPQLTFNYRDPEPNFNRRTVRGPLCKLFNVKDATFARALELAAGGRLYNVVTDDDSVSAKLIKNGNLARRTTFAPLNKIDGYRINQNVVKKAEDLVGRDNVFLALDLVSYTREYEKIMAWTFGNVFICRSVDVAKRVAFHPEIKKKCITIDGEVFDPQGIISGGAMDRSQPILMALIELVESETNLDLKQRQIDELNHRIQQVMPASAQYENCKQKIDLLTTELEMVKQRVQQTSHYQLQQEIIALQDNTKIKEDRVKECKKEIEVKQSKVSELEDKLKNVKGYKEREMKKAEAALKNAKKKYEDSREKWKQREQDFGTLDLEIKELGNSVQHSIDVLQKLQQKIQDDETELQTMKEELVTAREKVNECKKRVKEQKDEIGKKNKTLQNLVAQKEKLVKTIGEKNLEVSTATHKVSSLVKTISTLKNSMAEMKKHHKWIERERQFFDDMFDFKANDPKEIASKIATLKEQSEKISRNINKKAFGMLNNQEKEYSAVMDKKNIIEEDRSKILSVIEELDVKKEEVLKQAWQTVDKDLNSILGSLLPSAEARLRPSDGKTFMQGLEIKVAFGGMWKESLDELSGGQRSLVALSFILAMLLFKPAPIYILDEVDAALDPSHTQNIGQMLKRHFRQSQFIVVSLKDGMFTNANVLFRTSFEDGMSKVTRTDHTK